MFRPLIRCTGCFFLFQCLLYNKLIFNIFLEFCNGLLRFVILFYFTDQSSAAFRRQINLRS